MISLLLFIFYCILLQSGTNACTPVCQEVILHKDTIPSGYNNCTCKSEIDPRTAHLLVAVTPAPNCHAEYRSIKFRKAKTGAVIVQRAVVRACVSNDGTKMFVNQTKFEKEEKDYFMQRGYNKLRHVESTYSSWVFGFRTNMVQNYKKPDNHLRFG